MHAPADIALQRGLWADKATGSYAAPQDDAACGRVVLLSDGDARRRKRSRLGRGALPALRRALLLCYVLGLIYYCYLTQCRSSLSQQLCG